MLRYTYRDINCLPPRKEALDVDYYPNFLSSELAKQWMEYLLAYFSESSSRSTLIVGDPGLVYSVRYRGATSHRESYPWSDLPALIELKNLAESVTQQKYTVCVIQYYPSGKVGIGAHRDKEMVFGTRICGLSLGSTRTISFQSTATYPGSMSSSSGAAASSAGTSSSAPIEIALEAGSLYVMNPPTNQKYTHAILKDPKIKEPRISLTFRDYEAPK